MKRRRTFDLKGQVRRSSGEVPGGAVRAQRELSLRARFAVKLFLAHVFARVFSHPDAVSAAAIPLREPTHGRRTEDPNAHLAGLEFCVHVGVDFATEYNFFENRTGPSHNVHRSEEHTSELQSL